MKPKYILYDATFEKRVPSPSSDRMVFKVLKGEVVYFIEIGGHDVCY